VDVITGVETFLDEPHHRASIMVQGEVKAALPASATIACVRDIERRCDGGGSALVVAD
jgi:hypothetical protein